MRKDQIISNLENLDDDGIEDAADALSGLIRRG